MATIKLVEDMEGFKGLKPVWDELYAANPNLRVFQSFDWNFSVWNAYHQAEWPNDRLYIFYATRDGHAPHRSRLSSRPSDVFAFARRRRQGGKMV